MGGLLSIPSRFDNELNTFINTGPRLLDFIYNMSLKFL